jgi:hypothetical protein
MILTLVPKRLTGRLRWFAHTFAGHRVLHPDGGYYCLFCMKGWDG